MGRKSSAIDYHVNNVIWWNRIMWNNCNALADVCAFRVPRVITENSVYMHHRSPHYSILPVPCEANEARQTSTVIVFSSAVMWATLHRSCEWATCKSSVDSLVSGFVLPFKTINVLDMNPDAGSTSAPSSTSATPEPDTWKTVVFTESTWIIQKRGHGTT